ncbi:hypothetical protein CcaverHIS002_0211840 [Cutaneotrichosporon cavernicola]|uniref:Ricin B lectin domain-containing protein n=1 Tax=Cutaneotrichosporon cavernicola TaxID=279322 RepID=A0AA48KYW3_9TREE|nr:uncharacterized protein CcaverHIS019_0211860 [Cutaneotrichosporon cavernicola]BEI82024.1 hypothetical protein CcaverHIS002_0211840 [Cutaneotrichosporon cavernicola]BEI89824.1 hypothetical protein CcaverHIS019_0211860 [Cutaneotrichosporon cavernicola]BEI97594.1 hypothetical protein CcaverHIS631_0211830 [Cutaneotrichosporon cavernicola]BEJ05373.1 hypothetical protein CcaverHIS641_0211900 [Cutaneotrichosporon cavernicola]
MLILILSLLAPVLASTLSPKSAPHLCLSQSGEPGSAPLSLLNCKDAGAWRRDDCAFLWQRDETWCLGAGLKQIHPYLDYRACDGDNTEVYRCNTAGIGWFPDETGQVRASDAAFCLDVRDGKFELGARVQIWSCHEVGHKDFGSQQWVISE